jgi:hypothetical protein
MVVPTYRRRIDPTCRPSRIPFEIGLSVMKAQILTCLERGNANPARPQYAYSNAPVPI